jgi:hypothetical protein
MQRSRPLRSPPPEQNEEEAVALGATDHNATS